MEAKTDRNSIKTGLKRFLGLEGAWRYVVPFVLYVSIGDLTRLILPNLKEYHVFIGYTLRTALVGYVLFKAWERFPELDKNSQISDVTALLTGFVIFIIWIGLDGRYPIFYSSQTHYDPTLFRSELMAALILIRLLGSVFVAPLVEELFLRSFLIRFIISPKWEEVPIGRYTFESFLIVALVFGFSHVQWLPGIITGAVLNLLLYKKKNIMPCIVAHATANLLLLIYVVMTGSWFFY